MYLNMHLHAELSKPDSAAVDLAPARLSSAANLPSTSLLDKRHGTTFAPLFHVSYLVML